MGVGRMLIAKLIQQGHCGTGAVEAVATVATAAEVIAAADVIPDGVVAGGDVAVRGSVAEEQKSKNHMLYAQE